MVFAKKWNIELEKKDDIVHLEPLSDIHIGHAGFDEELYKKRIKAIAKDKHRYTLFLGDQSKWLLEKVKSNEILLIDGNLIGIKNNKKRMIKVRNRFRGIN